MPHVVADNRVDRLRMALAVYYYQEGSQEDAARIFKQLTRESKLNFVEVHMHDSQTKEKLKFIEECLDQIPQGIATPDVTIPVYQGGGAIFHRDMTVGYNTGTSQFTVVPTPAPPQPPTDVIAEVSPSIRKVVEECEKEWVMSSHTMYGLFAADWDKESELVPAFVRNSTASELAQHIAEAVQTDAEKFRAICDSVLKLDNNPMSSPWFDTTGGRLQSDIKYTLSPRGKVLQAVFRELVKDQRLGKVENADSMMQKVLDKLEMIMD